MMIKFLQVQFVSFQPHKWNQTFTPNGVKLPTPVLKVVVIIISISTTIIFMIQVSADKGFNFSNLDDAFIAQKKNHFQLTCHVVKVMIMMIAIMIMMLCRRVSTSWSRQRAGSGRSSTCSSTSTG